MSVSSNRSQTADTAKYLAAILVVAGHLIACDIQQLPSPYFYSNIINSIHMPFFCFVSGWFAVHMLEKGCLSVVRKAFIRLLLPYFVWSIIAVFAKITVSMVEGTFSVVDSIVLLGKTICFGTSLWFFQALFLIWLLAWAIYQLEKKSCWLALFAITAIMILQIPGENGVYALKRLHDLLPLFYAGFYGKRVYERSGFRLNQSALRMLLGCFGFIILLFSPIIATANIAWFDTLWLKPVCVGIEFALMTAVFSSICCLLHKSRHLDDKLAAWGRCSMDIYCIHMVFVEYIRFQMPNYVIQSNQFVSSIVYSAEAIIITILCIIITKTLRLYIKPYEWLMSGKWPININVLKGYKNVE